jgi:hypothetical protein
MGGIQTHGFTGTIFQLAIQILFLKCLRAKVYLSITFIEIKRPIFLFLLPFGHRMGIPGLIIPDINFHFPFSLCKNLW